MVNVPVIEKDLEEIILTNVWIKNKKNIRKRLLKKIFSCPLCYMDQKHCNSYLAVGISKAFSRRVFNNLDSNKIVGIVPLSQIQVQGTISYE